MTVLIDSDVLRKDIPSSAERRKFILGLTEIIPVVDLTKENVITSLENEEFKDFEDCLQSNCAEIVNAQYIITRNVKDYDISKIPAISPTDFLDKLK